MIANFQLNEKMSRINNKKRKGRVACRVGHCFGRVTGFKGVVGRFIFNLPVMVQIITKLKILKFYIQLRNVFEMI